MWKTQTQFFMKVDSETVNVNLRYNHDEINGKMNVKTFASKYLNMFGKTDMFFHYFDDVESVGKTKYIPKWFTNPPEYTIKIYEKDIEILKHKKPNSRTQKQITKLEFQLGVLTKSQTMNDINKFYKKMKDHLVKTIRKALKLEPNTLKCHIIPNSSVVL